MDALKNFTINIHFKNEVYIYRKVKQVLLECGYWWGRGE
jgi:hypothetical protein